VIRRIQGSKWLNFSGIRHCSESSQCSWNTLENPKRFDNAEPTNVKSQHQPSRNRFAVFFCNERLPSQRPDPPRRKAPAKPSPERLTMPKRNLRVVKMAWDGPAIGVCTDCNRQFKVPMTAMRRVADAQESLRLQFFGHKCQRLDESQNAILAKASTTPKSIR
jgi:hypothetical protein